MLPQEAMIERVRALCRNDGRVDAAMMYGSFTHGAGDGYSDIEFLIFFRNDCFEGLDRRAWLEQIAPVALCYVNEFGITAVVFANLVRGEFHFHAIGEVGLAEAWRGVLGFPSLESALIVDKSGALTPYLLPLIGAHPQHAGRGTAQFLANDFTNQYLFGLNVLRRGELARALEMLGVVQRLVLRLARVRAGKTERWFIPSRLLEQDLTPEDYARFRACVAQLDAGSLERAYGEIGRWAGELLAQLEARDGIDGHAALRGQIVGRAANQ